MVKYKTDQLTKCEFKAIFEKEHRWELKRGLEVCFGIKQSFDWDAPENFNADIYRVYNWICKYLNGGELKKPQTPEMTRLNGSGSDDFYVLRDELIVFGYCEWSEFFESVYLAWKEYRFERDGGKLSEREKRAILGQRLAAILEYLVWTEDAEQKYLTSLLAGNGFPLEQTMVFSYKTSSKIDAAAMMASFVSRIRPGVKLIIHRDRDFMTDAEVERLKQKYTHLQNAAISIMLTKFSDVEAYFSQPEHLCERAGMLLEEAQALLDDVIRELNNELVLKFRDKREQVKRDLYKTDPDNCPDTVSLIPAGQLLFSHSLGKSLMKKVNARIQAKGLNPNILIAPSAALFDAEIRALL